jgi:hypothetical protein
LLRNNVNTLISDGAPIRYGIAEPWKVKAAEIERTKPSRAPKPDEKKRKKNDGRPPDTVNELLTAPTKKSAVIKPPKPTIKDLLAAAAKSPPPPPSKTSQALITAPVTSAPPPPPKKTQKFEFGQPSYPWMDNSCWLDASLEVLYAAIEDDSADFCNLFESLDPDVGLGAFYTAIYDRLSMNPAQKDISACLASQGDQLRLFLYEKKLIDHIDQPESAVVS